MNAWVQGVLGPIPTTALGSTLFHEHIATRSLGVAENWPDLYDRESVLARVVEEINSARAAGVDTIVDHTPFDLGRDVPLLVKAAQRTGMNILTVTGFRELPPRAFQTLTAEQIADMWSSDVIDGMAGTAVRAALIKVAVEARNPSPLVRKCVEAAAIAHHQTAAPITAHTSSQDQSGHLVLDLLTTYGVAADRIVIGHAGDSTDLSYLTKLLERGAWLGLDRFGVVDVLPDEQRLAVLAQLISWGWADRLLLSHDASAWSGWRDNDVPDPVRPAWNTVHLHRRVRPAAIQLGIDQDRFDRLLRHNPCTFLTGESSAVSGSDDHHKSQTGTT